MSPLRTPPFLRENPTWRRLRHKMYLLFGERTNSHFTGFLRLPTQYEALVGPVISLLESGGPRSSPLVIGVLGCSNGAEAYTIASMLRRHHPQLAFRVRGYDIERAVVEKARTTHYEPEEIFNNKLIPDDFVEFTFDRGDGGYSVKPHIAERTEFGVADVLSPDLLTTVGPCDIVFAQNFIFHLDRRSARRALQNIVRLLRPGGVIYIDGVDLDLRRTLVRKKKLIPLDYQIEQIHNEARRARAVGWPYEYWGLEPFSGPQGDWKTRYATIFRAPCP